MKITDSENIRFDVDLDETFDSEPFEEIDTWDFNDHVQDKELVLLAECDSPKKDFFDIDLCIQVFQAKESDEYRNFFVKIYQPSDPERTTQWFWNKIGKESEIRMNLKSIGIKTVDEEMGVESK